MRLDLFSGERWVVPAIVFLLLAISPPFLSSFLLTLLTQALIYAILAMSLDIILGYTGLASLGHAAYLGLGAYSVGILTTRYAVGFSVALAAGVLMAVVVAAIFGFAGPRAPRGHLPLRYAPPPISVAGGAHRLVTDHHGE